MTAESIVYTEKTDMFTTPWGEAWTVEALAERIRPVVGVWADQLPTRAVVSNLRCNRPAKTITLRVAPVAGGDFRLIGEGVVCVLGDALWQVLEADVFMMEPAKKAPGVYELSLMYPKADTYPPDDAYKFITQIELDAKSKTK